MPHAMCVKWVRHNMLQTRRCRFVTKLQRTPQTLRQSLWFTDFIPVGTGSSFSRTKWPDCEADHLPNMVQRCVIVKSSISISGIILGHRKKFTLINGTSNLTHTTIPTILLYILTYLLKLAKCITFFQDKLVWCWHSQVQCMSVEVHYHSHHSWQIQLPDLSLNLTHSYNIKIEIQMYVRLYNEHYFLFRWHGH